MSKGILFLLKYRDAKQHNIILMSVAKDHYRNNFKSCINLTVANYFCKIHVLIKILNENMSIKIKCTTGPKVLKENKWKEYFKT